MSKPSFKALFEEFLEQYNTQDLDNVQPYISPSIQFKSAGSVKGSGASAVMTEFVSNWAQPNSKVTLKSIEELSGQDGVKVVQGSSGGDTTYNYLYAKQGGRWVITERDAI